MTNKMIIEQNKTLKLSNVLTRRIEENELSDYAKIVQQMDHYIKSKGYMPIGPLIQFSDFMVEADGTLKVHISLLRQSNEYIKNIEYPYTMESIKKIANCMYVRFRGLESDIKFAYDKINLAAYEQGITLTGNSYTVFVEQIQDDLVADIFMEKKYV